MFAVYLPNFTKRSNAKDMAGKCFVMTLMIATKMHYIIVYLSLLFTNAIEGAIHFICNAINFGKK